MAKKISQDNQGQDTDQTQAPAADTKAAVAIETADLHITNILKAFPGHPELYIDKHGGAYTPQTPKAIRGTAILYKNPFFKP